MAVYCELVQIGRCYEWHIWDVSSSFINIQYAHFADTDTYVVCLKSKYTDFPMDELVM